jgi:hypothetical protein
MNPDADTHGGTVRPLGLGERGWTQWLPRPHRKHSERNEEHVALRVDLLAPMSSEGLPEQHQTPRQHLADLLTGNPTAVVVADKGLWGRSYSERLAAGGTRLLTPDRTTHRRQRA